MKIEALTFEEWEDEHRDAWEERRNDPQNIKDAFDQYWFNESEALIAEAEEKAEEQFREDFIAETDEDWESVSRGMYETYLEAVANNEP